MSFDTTRIHCTGCDYTHPINYEPILLKYRTERGVVSYYRTNAWCFECAEIVDAEGIMTVDEIKEHYKRCYGVPGPPVNWFKNILRYFDRKYQSKLSELENKISWREMRVTPPKCLACGTSNIEILNFVDPNKEDDEDELTIESITKEHERLSNPDRHEIAVGFRHSCGGELIHKFNNKSGLRYNFATQIYWMDLDGNIISREIE